MSALSTTNLANYTIVALRCVPALLAGLALSTCGYPPAHCGNERRFELDDTVTRDDVLEICRRVRELRHFGSYYGEESVHLDCLDGVPPPSEDLPIVPYVPTCEELCWIRQQRFVETQGTGTLVEPASEFYFSSRDLPEGASLLRDVESCSTTIDLEQALSGEAPLGELRCQGREYVECRLEFCC